MFWTQLLDTLSDEERDFVSDLYEQYKDEMYRTALGILKNDHDAQDAVNNIMLAVIRNLSKYEGQSDISIRNQLTIYMRSIIKNTAINAYNKRKRIRQHEADSILYDNEEEQYTEIEFEDETYILENIVIAKDELNRLNACIVQLPQDIQDTLNLVCVCGYTSREAANVLMITPEAVRARIFYARKKLKKMMEVKADER